MPVIHGISGFYSAIETWLREAEPTRAGRLAQIIAAPPAFGQLCIASLISHMARPETPERFGMIVVPTNKDVRKWVDYGKQVAEALASSGDADTTVSIPVTAYPSLALWGNDRFVNPGGARRQRLGTLAIAAQQETPGIIVTTLPAIAQFTMTPRDFTRSTIRLKVGEEYDLDEVMSSLDDLGYQKSSKVDEEGHWAVRGSILDVFALNHGHPLRLEFLGDEVTSIRTFTIDDQRSREKLEAASICPALEASMPMSERETQTQTLYDHLLASGIDQSDREGMISAFSQGYHFAGIDMFLPVLREEQATLLDHLKSEETTLIFPGSVEACSHSTDDFASDLENKIESDREGGRVYLPASKHFSEFSGMQSSLTERFSTIEFNNPYESQEGLVLRLDGSAPLAVVPSKDKQGVGRFKSWKPILAKKLDEGSRILILFRSKEGLERALRYFEEQRMAVQADLGAFGTLLAGRPLTDKGTGADPQIHLGLGCLDSHIWLEDAGTLVIDESELFGVEPKRKGSGSGKLRSYLSSFKDLKSGDLVVHLTHGIARYLGMTTLAIGGVSSDFLIIEFAGADKIYLPVEKLGILQRYSSDSGGSGRLDKLGGQAWTKKKSRVKKAIRDMADELLKIQAQRRLARAHVYSVPGQTYRDFEADFPYQETDDQLKALEDIENDLSQGDSMDRLVVGDVGFGKTEVALRVCLRAVLDGHQVMVLTPTTILCYQHFQTFKGRLAKYGIEVAQINRFVGPKASKETLARLEAGRIDVIVGTHRVLSKDVRFRKLGLLVVDEEQRFGVTHKERIKSIRASADVLTLSATPIPRTLHMAMLGLRKISIIATPPSNRLAVRTYVSKFDSFLVKEALTHELARGGQIFFVHNRVEDIEEAAAMVRELIPGIEVRIGHGQMSETQLEKVIRDFIDQKYSVLVCTTIIESGIDMPNVNTIIVNRADRFGLSQLYQLRGRVGRSSVQAFAYFLTPRGERITEDAAKRLEVIAAYQDLGSGFHIASHDLEIRGAGNLLGAEQSGQVAEVGLELYTDMLAGVIRDLQGEKSEENLEVEFTISVSAIIPPGYVDHESDRLAIYKEMFSVKIEDELAEIRSGLVDRYGSIPGELERLFRVAEIKLLLRLLSVKSLAPGKLGFFEIVFASLEEKQIAALAEVAVERAEDYRLTPDFRLVLSEKPPSPNSPEEQDRVLGRLRDLMEYLHHHFVD